MEKELRFACEHGDIDVIRRIISNGVDMNALYATIRHRFSILGIVCSNIYTEIFKLFLDSFPALDLNRSVTKYGHTPLAMACEYGRYEIIKIILQRPGIDVNKPTEDDCTPLWLAANEGDLKSVEYLLIFGSNIDVELRGHLWGHYSSAAGIAICRGRQEIAALIYKYQSDPRTTIHALCKKHGLIETRPAELFLTLLLLIN